MRRQTFLLTALVSAVLSTTPYAGVARADTDVLHNSTLPWDVDGNRLVQARDAELVIELLKRSSPNSSQALAPLSQTDSSFFFDTTNDHFVSPRDAALVINHLLLAPEPSTLLLAGLGFVAVATMARRRPRRCT